ncbi:hypothetical protein SR870_18650 [Rhodopseudomonas palustris]|uniref:hypothetical protein n=1 Tax=Rhodopseudomonas palustris TaxID=1076 RepID=UPI002ACD73E0|nr:hypothetical protein [Rhodopseudomonas palustris]WQG98693.1 hypothetical protein SR870_18650 [Rhodopseudomonas palustris]
MIRAMTKALGLAAAGLAAALLLQTAEPAQAQTSMQARPSAAAPLTDVSAQERRPPRRLRIYPRVAPSDDVYPRYFPGRNAVRECTATYVQEYRPSGTVITPRMNCFWRRG